MKVPFYEKLKNAAAWFFWLLVWQCISMLAAKPLLLPSPLAVFIRLCRLCVTKDFLLSVLVSLVRVVAGIVSAVVAGVLFAVLSVKSRTFEILIRPLLTAVKSTPVASFTLLLLVWLNRSAVPSVISALIVLPVVESNVCTGIRSTDVSLLEMARVFRLPRGKILKKIYLPSVRPHFLSACRSAIGFGWKAGIAAEVLTVPVFSIGKMIYESKLYLQTTDLFAWTAATVILSVIIEKLTLKIAGGGKND